jgi:4-hydroxyphenylpyruvate dioxygenase
MIISEQRTLGETTEWRTYSTQLDFTQRAKLCTCSAAYHQGHTSIAQAGIRAIQMAPSAIPPDSPPVRPAGQSGDMSNYRGYDHVHWYVGNAKQAASYYITRLGFKQVAYRGLETGSRCVCSHVVRNGDITFVLTSPLRSLDQIDRFDPEDQELLKEIHRHLEKHGDGVKDVAFQVDSVDAVYAAAVQNGAVVVSPPKILKDEAGQVKIATIQTYGDTIHTLVERKAYTGCFFPGFRAEAGSHDPVASLLPGVQLKRIDHCVGNQDWNEMEGACE